MIDLGIPLSHLVEHSPYLRHIRPPPPHSVLVRAIRTHAADALEVRVRVTAPSKAAWYGKDASTTNDSGGYEIRLKHLDDVLTRVGGAARDEWEARTVYLVRGVFA